MASIDTLKASDGTGNASVATVQSVRSPGATTLVVDTVQGINTKFHATMGTPHTFVDPVTSETITVISEATAVDFVGHVDGSNLEIDTIAPGFTDAGSAVNDIVIIKPTTQWADEVATVLEVSHDDDGTLKTGAVDNAAVLANDVVETAKIKDAAVTPAKWTNPYKFYAYRSAAHNSSGTAAKVPYESELYDSNSNFSTANNDYTAPVAGFYDFHATAGNTAAASTPMQIILYKNGSAILYGQIIQPGAAGNNLTLSGSLQLAANDVIDVRFVGGGGSVMYTGATTCYFQGHLFTIT